MCFVPRAWKRANIIPIQKKKGDFTMINYRPISILPTISKVLERIVHHQILDH